jgi:transmembrane sensor
MQEDRFYILVSKKMYGKLTAEEAEELALYFTISPNYLEIYQQLSGQLNTTDTSDAINNDKVLQNLRSKLSSDPTYNVQETATEIDVKETFWKRYRRPIVKLSFIALAFISAFVILFLREKQTIARPVSVSENNVSTRPGSKSQVTLPDGTTVILNADSKLTYPDNFLGETREVSLEGEAYFNVTHNKKKPFIIHTKAIDIKVLGTVFNVKAYPQESTSEATLIKGSIEVTLTSHSNEKIMLKPSEKITVSNLPLLKKQNEKPKMGINTEPATEETPLVMLDHVSEDKKENIYSEIGWTQNKLMFKNESLDEIVKTMEHWYGCNIEVKSDKLKLQKFTGNFTEESCMQVLQALQLSYNFSFKKENNNIIIY